MKCTKQAMLRFVLGMGKSRKDTAICYERREIIYVRLASGVSIKDGFGRGARNKRKCRALSTASTVFGGFT